MKLMKKNWRNKMTKLEELKKAYNEAYEAYNEAYNEAREAYNEAREEAFDGAYRAYLEELEKQDD